MKKYVIFAFIALFFVYSHSAFALLVKVTKEDGTVAWYTIEGTINGTNVDIYKNNYGHYTNAFDKSIKGSIDLSEVWSNNFEKHYQVTSIGDWAFYGCSGLTSVTIPSSVTSIGSCAFFGCTGLTLVVIPSSVTSIGDRAFRECSGLTSVSIPNSVTSIGYGAFESCSSLTSVTIPNSVTKIWEYTFRYCSGLTSITIPNNVTTIGNEAFLGCTGLTSIEIPNSVTSIGSQVFDNCNSLKNVSINTETIGGWFSGIKSIQKITIGEQVTSIGYGAFSGCSGLTSLVIPNSVTTIGESAFSGCSGLTTVLIGNGVTNIGNSAFLGCSGLSSVNINSSDAWLGISFNNATANPLYYAHNLYLYIPLGGFMDDIVIPLSSFTFSENVTSIKDYAFVGFSGMSDIIIPNSITSIGNSSFMGCSGLTSITIPNSVTSIGNSAFVGCTGLTSITIPNCVTSIGNSAFVGCSGLTSITIPNSVDDIGNNAFAQCSNLATVSINSNTILSKSYSSSSSINNIFGSQVTKYVIGTDVTSIGNYVFYGCTGLTSIEIPSSVTKIGGYSFQDCSGLTSITIPYSVTSIGYNAFTGCNNLSTVTINSNTILSKSYSSSSNINNIFGSQVTKYVIGTNVTSIGNYVFYGCTGLTSVNIPNSVTTIGDYAFRGCSGLTSITIPNSVTKIGSYSFQDCSGLTSIVVESGNSVYDSRNNCNAIIETATNTLLLGCERTNIPNSVTSIGNSAFLRCSGLTSIDIPSSVTSIGASAFYDCSGLTSVTIPNSVTSIGYRAFYNSSSIIILPNNVTYIGTDAFYQCTSLFVKKGTVSLLSCWNSGYTPLQIGTENELNKPYVEIISTTQTTATLKLINEYSEYTYTDNGGRKITPKGGVFTITGLRPELSNNYYIKVSLGDVYYTTSQISFNTKNISPSVRRTGYTASSVTVSGSYIAGDASVTSQKLTLNGMSAEGNSHTFTGLDPNKSYTAEYSITVAYGQGYTSTYTGTINVSTKDLSLTTSQPKVISAGNVIVAAESNLDDEETNVGFEWRRIDYTSEFPSYTGTAYLYNGTMEGYIRSLYTEKLWKYRPYYTSNAGNTYYGEWMGIDPTNTSYFEPTVHTYANVTVNGNSAEVKGYVQRGTDNVVSKGFAYWEQSQGVKAREAMSAPSLISSLPSNAKTVEISGSQQVMTASLPNLEYETTYCYVAFVRTSEGDTFYGEEMTFTSGESPYILGDVNGDKEIDISDVVAMVNHILGNTSSTSFKPQAADINKDSNIDISDVVALVNMILGQ